MWLYISIVLLVSQTPAVHGGILSKSHTAHQKNNENHDAIPNECDLCEHEFTIILGTGRSGSSTLLGMLNLLPQYDISGEHNGQLFKFKDLYDDILKVKYMTPYAWAHKKQEIKKFLCYVQKWYVHESGLKETWKQGDVHGFKEIVSAYCARRY